MKPLEEFKLNGNLSDTVGMLQRFPRFRYMGSNHRLR